MFLRKYADPDFPILQSWVTDPDLLFQFAGSNWTYPLTFEDIRDYQLTHPLKQSYMLCDQDGVAIAFGELISGEAYAPRIGRLLVGGRENRGKGIGTLLIKLMIAESRKQNDQNFIHLFVFEDNLQAIRCYENLGFKFNPEVTIPLTTPGGIVKSTWLMTLTFDE